MNCGTLMFLGVARSCICANYQPSWDFGSDHCILCCALALEAECRLEADRRKKP
jgi:hypothetical protein